MKKIPKFIYLLFGTILALVLFMIFVGTPLINNASSMQKDHQDTQNLLRDYDNALSLEQSIEDEIKRNQDEFELKKKDLFVDLDSCSKDIEKYCSDNNIDLSTYTIAEPRVDQYNRVSTGGYPVYTVNISLSYSDSYDKTMSLLKYLENGSNGCYYIKSCTMSAGSNAKAADAFQTSLSIELYYYNMTNATK